MSDITPTPQEEFARVRICSSLFVCCRVNCRIKDVRNGLRECPYEDKPNCIQYIRVLALAWLRHGCQRTAKALASEFSETALIKALQMKGSKVHKGADDLSIDEIIESLRRRGFTGDLNKNTVVKI